MLYLTDTLVQEMFPAAATLAPEDITQLANDAGAVYSYLQGGPFDDTALQAWAQTQELPPARLTLALELLRSLGRVTAVPDIVAPPTTSARPRGRAKR